MVMRKGIWARLGRLWFLLCETPALILIVFVFLFGKKAVYAYSSALESLYIVNLDLLLLTSIGILVFGRTMRWVGALGFATVVFAILASPPAVAE
jgi:hypothetical protein